MLFVWSSLSWSPSLVFVRAFQGSWCLEVASRPVGQSHKFGLPCSVSDAMESYVCQPYAIRVGAQVLQVHVARRGQLTALFTLGTSNIAMTRQMQARVILPHELDAAGWCRYFPPEIQPLSHGASGAWFRNRPSLLGECCHQTRSGWGDSPCLPGKLQC